jgi:hypothetical protein
MYHCGCGKYEYIIIWNNKLEIIRKEYAIQLKDGTVEGEIDKAYYG